ncbi:MAG: ATP-binding protein [Nitrospiraceae bacterium]|nr:ATP-binding protein [Nitrospiraceae bacterium]
MARGNKKPGKQQILRPDILSVIDAIGDEITIQDTDFRIVYQNSAFISKAGRHTGQYCYEAYGHTGQVCEGCQLEMAFRDGGVHRVARKVSLNNETRYAEITASALRDAAGRIIAGIEVVRDITDRVRIEEQLSQAKRDWEDIFNQITEMITVHDMDFNIVRANKAAEKILGLPAPGEGEAKCFKYYHGNSCPPANCPSCASLGSMLHGTAEYFEPHLNRFLEVTAVPRFDAAHKPAGLIHIGRDITERKRLESIAQAASLMDNLGYVFSGIRHEIGNPVNAAKLTLSALKTKLPAAGPGEIGKNLDAALEQLSRVEFLLKSLRNFNMFEDMDVAHICLSAFMERFFGLAGRDFLERGIEIVSDIASDVQCAFADERALHQILLNIAANAADALSGAENPRITFRARKLGSMVIMTVEDNGRGIPRGNMKDLFKPFYTTKASGTGLGLVIVKKMMLKMGGEVEITSEEGRGTAVNLFLPCRGQAGKPPGRRDRSRNFL